VVYVKECGQVTPDARLMVDATAKLLGPSNPKIRAALFSAKAKHDDIGTKNFCELIRKHLPWLVQ